MSLEDYLPLEVPNDKKEFYRTNKSFKVLDLNSGRSAFYFAVKSGNIKKIFLPYFACPKTEDPFIKNGVKIEYYFLNDDLTPKDIKIQNNDYLLWTNYFGNATDSEIKKVVNNYKNLIIDNCNEFFFPPIKGIYNCYSTRKFFRISDGGYLINSSLNVQKK